MDLHSIILLLIFLGMILSFFRQWLPIELTAATGLILFVITGFMPPEEAFSGFASPVTITLISMFAMGAALASTGVTDRLASLVYGIVKKNERGNIVLVMLLGALFSSFMNNVAAAALLMPVVASISFRTAIPQSRMLMPLSFATILGGMCTLIGTPPNLLAHDALRSHGLTGYSLFEFLPFGAGISIVGIIYMGIWGYQKLPVGSVRLSAPTEQDLPRIYGVDKGLVTIRVSATVGVGGSTLADLGFGHDLGLIVATVYHAGKPNLAPSKQARVFPGDILIVSGRVEDAAKLAHIGDLVSQSEIKELALSSNSIAVFEAVLSPRSQLIGQTLQQINFRERYGCQVLSILRRSDPICAEIGSIPLEFGDGLLLQGPRSKLAVFLNDPDFLVLTDVRAGESRHKKAPFVIGGLLTFFVLVALQILPVHVAAFIAMMIVLLSGALSTEELYRGMSWRVVFFVASILPLGIAVKSSGFPDWLSHEYLMLVGAPSALVLLATFCFFGSVVSQLIEPSLAVILLAPVAIGVAERTHVLPAAILMALTLGSSIGFQTPFSQRANLLVMAAGGYSVRDYLRVGLPLSIVTGITAVALVYLGYGIR